MSEDNIPSNPNSRFINRLLVVSIGVLLLYLTYIAITLKINFFDSISIFMNAKAILAGEAVNYYWKRPPFLPIILSPLFSLDQSFAVIIARMLSVGFLGAFVVACYRFLSIHLDRTTSLCGATLLLLNPLLIHYGPFAKEDIIGALLTTLAFYYYYRNTQDQTKKNFILTSFFITCAILTRYNLLPIIFMVIVIFEVLSGKSHLLVDKSKLSVVGKETGKKILYYFVLPIVFFLLIPTLLYTHLKMFHVGQSFLKFIDELFFFFTLVSTGAEAWTLNVEFLIKQCSWPVIVMGVIGVYGAFHKRQEGTLFHSIWLSVFLIVHSFVIGHKEARFLFPLLVPVYFFVAVGVRESFGWIYRTFKSIHNEKTRFTLSITVILLIVFPFALASTIQECLKFQDPLFQNAHPKKVSLAAKRLADGHKIHWVGKMYPYSPEVYKFHESDKKTNIFDFYSHTVRFYTGDDIVQVLEDANLMYPEGGKAGIFIQNVGPYINDKDVLIINPNPENYSTGTLPISLRPLSIQRARKITFNPQNEINLDRVVYTTSDAPGAILEIVKEPNGYQVRGVDIPYKYSELYLFYENTSITYTPVEANSKGIFLIQGEESLPADIEKIIFLAFEGKKDFLDQNQIQNLGKIQFGKRVKMDYILTVDGKEEHDSRNHQPLTYIHGQEGILPYLGMQLEGLKAGDQKTVMIEPKNGYGEEDPTAFVELPISIFFDGQTHTVGEEVDVELKDGRTVAATISEIKGGKVRLNLNHPLAGKKLEYQVTILNVE